MRRKISSSNLMLKFQIVADHLQTATLPVIYETLKGEGKDGVKRVELELLSKLEVFMNKKKEEEEYDEYFEDIMANRFNVNDSIDGIDTDEKDREAKSSKELTKLLMDYKSASDTNIMTLKIFCTNQLMEYYDRLNEKDLYFKSIHKLVELHVACHNFTEAGMSLKLHGDSYEWRDDINLESFLTYPAQTEWERKEKLFTEIIDHFDAGKEWEKAITLCRELNEQYKKRKKFKKLAELMRKQASLYDSIVEQSRQPPTYFRVSFYGKGFPSYLKDEVLIFRGLELETLAGFTNRIQNEFPDVKILYKNGQPEESITEGDDKYVQICTVIPSPVEESDEMDEFGEIVQSYQRLNNVDEFSFKRPFHKGERDPSNEFKTLWLERTFQTINNKFPNILSWSKITETKTVELSPIENAMEMIRSKNQELSAKVEEYSPLMKSNANQLSMVLNGVIDANVNGGIANYQSAFLSEEYLENHPNDKTKVEELNDLLLQQSNILKSGLDIHEYYVTEALRPFHDKMVMMYSAMKVSIETGQPMENLVSNLNNTLEIRRMTMPAIPSARAPRLKSKENSVEIRREANFGRNPLDLNGFSNGKEVKKSITSSIMNKKKKTKKKEVGLTSLIGALHEESSKPRVNMFSPEATFDMGMMESYSPISREPSPLMPRESSVSSFDDLISPPMSPADELTYPRNSLTGSETKQSISSISDISENGDNNNMDLNNNDKEIDEIKKKKKTRQLIKVSLKNTKVKKNQLSGKEYTL